MRVNTASLNASLRKASLRDFPDSQGRQELVRAHSDTPSARQHNFHLLGKLDALGVPDHFFHVGTVDGLGKVNVCASVPTPASRCTPPQCRPTDQTQ